MYLLYTKHIFLYLNVELFIETKNINPHLKEQQNFIELTENIIRSKSIVVMTS